ncbi:MAG: hypothetical protein ACD_69C00154G0001, partial [uncultured bacterium]
MYMSNKEAHKQLIQLLDIKIKLSSGYSLPKIG